MRSPSLKQLRQDIDAPLYLIGFSLGGNVVLKLAGELGERARGLIAGVCAVSTPIDLAACVRLLDRPSNFLYAKRFLKRLRQRIETKERLTPGLFDLTKLASVKTIYDFDDTYTAPAFGFGTAANYYATQSAQNFLDRIRVPTLLVQAKDDPLIPFDIYSHRGVFDQSLPEADRSRTRRPPRIHIQDQAALLARWPAVRMVTGKREQTAIGRRFLSKSWPKLRRFARLPPSR